MADEKSQGTVSQLLDFAGDRRALTIAGCALSAVAMAVNMVPYVCIWLVIRELVAVAPSWTEATGIVGYGWTAFGFAVAGIVVYFGALMCTHLAAFRTATNIRKRFRLRPGRRGNARRRLLHGARGRGYGAGGPVG